MQLVFHQCNLIQFVRDADGLGEPDLVIAIPPSARLCTSAVRQGCGSPWFSSAFQYDPNGEVEEMFADEQFNCSISFFLGDIKRTY